MSVLVVLKIQGNPNDLEAYAQGPGAEVMLRVAEAGKAGGAMHHLFAAGENEVIVVDEWPDEQSFHAFFAGQADIPEVMRAGGAQGQPQISVYRMLDTPDRF